ncbi:MAG: hypothetical protein PHG27_11945 [Massilibacteroides sp.]|nr:hypothetical protein [Massilibacteroides sp.]
MEKEMEPLVVLHLEGIFWKAYEWSAFRFVREIKSYKVQKRYVKQLKREIVSLGFPQEVLERILPLGCSLVSKEEKCAVVRVSESGTTDAFNVWKANVEEGEKKEQPMQPQSLAVVQEEFVDYGASLLTKAPPDKKTASAKVIEKLQAFQVEVASPIQCMMFVSELQACLKEQL